MKSYTRSSFAFVVVGAAVWILGIVPVSWGQKPPPPANPQAPTINPLLPAGIQRGLASEFVLTGTNLGSPTGVSLNCPAKVIIPTEDKNGQDPAKCKVKIEVPADTPIGWYAFRFATLKGVSNLRVICVDEVPQVASTGTNRSKSTAQEFAVPGAVTGATAAEQGDFYKFTAKAGQRLSFDCQARRIGSAIDAQMTIYDAKTMREIAFDNDSPGCQTDPRIVWTFKQGGDYLIEIKDVLNRGGAEFFYRIRVGEFPMASTPMPMAAKRGTKAKIAFAGPAVDGVLPVEIAIPEDPAATVAWATPKAASGLQGWPVPVQISDLDEAVEQEPNNDIKQANRILAPGAVTGRFQQGGDVDNFLFSAKKGQKLSIEAHTIEVGSASLVQMYVKSAKTGAEVAKSNPAAPPPGDQRFDFTAPDDGDFILEMQHLILAGGHSETYRVTLRGPTNSFDLVLPNERFDVAPGAVAAVPVQVVRKGYTGPIELTATGNAGLTATANIKAGQNAAVLLVVAKGDLPMGAYQFSIVGKATVDGKAHVQTATAKAAVIQALNGLAFPPPHLANFVSLAVKEKAPFSLAIKMEPPEGIPGGAAKVTITATRDAGFTDEITLAAPSGLPPTIPAPKLTAIPKDKSDITFPLDLNAKTPLGEYFVLFSAKTKFQGKEYSAAAPPLVLVLGLPFDLQVEAKEIALNPGERVKLKVTANRKGGYTGPIALDVRKLPATVTATKVVIAATEHRRDRTGRRPDRNAGRDRRR